MPKLLLKGSGFSSIAVNADHSIMAIGKKDGTLDIMHVYDTVLTLAHQYSAHKAKVHRVSFSSTGAYLSSASWDRSVNVYSVGKGGDLEPLYERLENHASFWGDLKFTKDERKLITCNRNEIIVIPLGLGLN